MLTAEDCATYEGVAGVYLLAFYRNGAHVPYGTGRYGQGAHYLGWAANIGRRLAEHRAGQGARFTRAVCLAGYELRIVRIWPGATRQDERRMKDSHNAARYCPVCAFHLGAAPVPLVPSLAIRPALFPVPALGAVLAS